MAEIKPFKALTYNREMIPDLSKVVTPPYDVISPTNQQKYYDLDPHNIIRLILGRDDPDDNEAKNRYSRAAGFLERWQKDGALRRQPVPAIYVYDFTYPVEGEEKSVLGFISLVRLAEFDSGTVLPHEKTFAGPKADRLKLMQACNANLDQVFSIYSEQSGDVHKLLAEEAAKEPLLSVEGDAGVRHRIWAITDANAINRLHDKLSDKALFIADGHHRYETALNYANWRSSLENAPIKDAGYNFIPMLLIDVANEALSILPTHRLIKNLGGLGPQELLRRLNSFFAVERQSNLGKMTEKMRRYTDRHIFGLYFGGDNYYLLTLSDKIILDDYLPAGTSKDWKKLDAAILQYLVLEEIVGIKDQGHGGLANLSFTENQNLAVEAVDRQEAAAAILMNPTKMEQVEAVARNREKMPQKSTFFYPKPLTGLIMNLIDEEAGA